MVTRWRVVAAGVCLAALLAVCAAAALWGGRGIDGANPVDSFLWRFNGDLGMAVTHTIRHSDFPNRGMPENLQVVVRLSDQLAEYWQVEEAQAYYREGDRRIRLLRQGPYPDPEATQQPTVTAWALYGLRRDSYEFCALLRQRKPGLSPERVRRALARGDGITFELRSATETTELASRTPPGADDVAARPAMAQPGARRQGLSHAGTDAT